MAFNPTKLFLTGDAAELIEADVESTSQIVARVNEAPEELTEEFVDVIPERISVLKKFNLDPDNIVHQSFDDKCSDYIQDILSHRREE
jgi:hypothetical protein